MGDERGSLESLVIFRDIFRNQTVLITGHTGFKGAWLAIWLQQLGANVVGYALAPPTIPSLFQSAGLNNQLEDLRGDIRKNQDLYGIIDRFKPKFIFHLAALSLVRASYVKPIETFDTNIMGTVSLLDAVRENRHPCTIVIVSSDKCYENRESDHAYQESDSLGGYDPYSASKGAMEIVVGSYRQSFFSRKRPTHHEVRLASARAGNVIGGGDWGNDRIVPDAIRALSSGKTVAIRHPNSIRPWQHVLEPLSGYLWLAAKMSMDGGERFAGGWNFGPEESQSHTVGELTDAVIKAWGSGSWTNGNESGPHEARLLKLSTEKARTELGWKPVWDFSTTVRQTITWYREFINRDSDKQFTYQLCAAEIAEYQDTAKEQQLAWTI